MTRVERACIAVLAIAGVTGLSTTARAQSAEAEALFRDGRALLKHGQLAAGCDKLAASERLESSVGTLLNLGDCREKLGQVASAWAAFRKAEAMAKRNRGDDRRQAEAQRRAAQLEPRLATFEIDVPQHIEGLIVHRDGEFVGDAQWTTALPIDPGSYTIVAEAPGYQAWRTTVVIGAGARREVVVIPSLLRVPVDPVPAISATPLDEPPPPAEPFTVGTTRGAGTWSTTRALSVGLALAGAGALGTGVYFGVHAGTLEGRSDRRCPQSVCGDSTGLLLNDQAQDSARRANILYIAGGGTLATAVVLWLVGAPDETKLVPTAGEHQLGVALKGRF